MSVVADKLREARALIERGWTQGCFARRKNGSATYVEDNDAVCWCAAGALYHSRSPIDSGIRLLLQAVGRRAGGNIAEWNDAPERTQAEVLAAFDKAILLAEAQS